MKSENWTRRGFLLKLGTLSSAIATSLYAPAVWAANNKHKVTGAKLSGNAKQLKFSIALDSKARYKTFMLNKPDRVVIDLFDTNLSGSLKAGKHDRPPLNGIRYAKRGNGALRIVLDMNQSVTTQAKIRKSGSQHVLDIAIKPKAALVTRKKPAKPQRKVNRAQPAKHHGKFTVVIDAGHGGRDPGAVGKRGTKEKDVVLAVARKLQALINKNRNMRAVLTRASDKYIPLRKRLDLAHQNKADLFISIHADANHNRNLSGSSVYILSNKGASSEAARLLAESENSYEVKFGNSRLSERDNRLASVLLDLSQSATTDQSLNFAKGVLKELSKVNNPLRRRVESAGFMVLKSPDIPSMLVETAFISNPAEERRLRTSHYQQKLANALYRGVRRYQLAYAPNFRNASAS